jgi:hypothetical protein
VMTDTPTGANALLETTNRRAVLGGVLAAGALGATAALPAYAAPGVAQLSATDRRVLDLWSRRNRMRAALERISNQMNAAASQMPEWTRGGPKYVLAQGEIPPNRFGLDISRLDPGSLKVGWPQVADVDQQLVAGSGWILARPNVEDLYAQFQADLSSLDKAKCRRDEARRRLTQALLAHDARLKEQEIERDRVGYNRLSSRSEAGWKKVLKIERAIRDHAGTSVLALAASLLISIQDDDDEEVYRATLRIIRPQLVGAIA